MIDFITFCDYTGTFAFAISGIRLASAKQFDWFGAYVVGVVTAVGGGTIRDILLNATPFWMEQASYLRTLFCIRILQPGTLKRDRPLILSYRHWRCSSLSSSGNM